MHSLNEVGIRLIIGAIWSADDNYLDKIAHTSSKALERFMAKALRRAISERWTFDDDGEDWITLNGEHVKIGSGGMITVGPVELVGKTIEEITKSHSEHLPSKTSGSIIKVGTYEINTAFRTVKQREHVQGSREYENKLKTSKRPPSFFYSGIDIDALVRLHIGKHGLQESKGGALSEYFDADDYCGEYYESKTGKMEPTKRVCIR